jgi:spermidine synthase
VALYASILLLSAAALGYELLLLRLLSITGWQHFAAMVISLALLGYGASGTLLSLARRRLVARAGPVYLGSCLLFALGSVGGFALAQRVPFRPVELVWDPRQTAALLGVYLLLAVPFLGAATAIGLALARFPERIHHLYRADLLGAGLGASAVLALLCVLRPEAALRLVSAGAVLAAALAAWDRDLGRRARACAVLALAVVPAGLAWPRAWIAPRISPFKALPQALLAPGASLVAERSSPLALLSVVRSPRIPLRHAPGLSPDFPGRLPEQLAIFSDADALRAVNRFSGDPASLAYLDWTTAALPYHLTARRRVLVLGAGAGSPVVSAVEHGAARVDAVERDRELVALVEEDLGEFSGRPYSLPGVTLHAADPRAFAAMAAGPFDLVLLDLGEAHGLAGGGLEPLAESFLVTVEALDGYLELLAPGGFLAVTGAVEVPPRTSLKLFATAIAALERRSVAAAARLAWIRSWSTTTLLVKQEALDARETAAIRAFCDERSFDLAYLPGLTAAESNRFNLLAEPYYFAAASALLGPGREAFRADYKFDVSPATDERPYLARSFRWRSLPELLALRRRGGAPLLQWGYLLLVATLLQAAAAGAALVLLPAWALARRGGGGAAAVGGYFLGLGLAFLFVEVMLIQRLTLLLGHPLLAAGAVLGAFLVFSGLGSGAARRLRPLAERTAGQTLCRRLGSAGVAATLAAALAAAYAVALPLLEPWPPLPAPLVIGLAAALVAPLAFVMGMPFPLGLEELGRARPDWLPWAWGVNGCASVLSPVAATLLSIHIGSTAVLGLAALLYLAAACVAPGGSAGRATAIP